MKRIIPVLTDDEMSRLQKTIESGDISHRDSAIVLLGLSIAAIGISIWQLVLLVRSSNVMKQYSSVIHA